MSKTEKPDIVEERRSMGIGPMGQSDAIFVRKFRWTLETEKLPEHFMKCVKLNFKKKTVNFSCYEVILREDQSSEIAIQKWLDMPDHKDETMTFTTYDGCGDVIYQMKFSGIEVVNDESDFDYASSEASVREVTVTWNKCERTISENVVFPSDRLDNLKSKLAGSGDSK